MRMERHFINEVGVVLSAYLKDTRSDCPGIDLSALHHCVRHHVRKRTQHADDWVSPPSQQYIERCEALLSIGVQMTLMFARDWASKEDLWK